MIRNSPNCYPQCTWDQFICTGHTVTHEWHSDPVPYRQNFVLLFISTRLTFVLSPSIILLTTAFEKSSQKYFTKHEEKVKYSSNGKNTPYALLG